MNNNLWELVLRTTIIRLPETGSYTWNFGLRGGDFLGLGGGDLRRRGDLDLLRTGDLDLLRREDLDLLLTRMHCNPMICFFSVFPDVVKNLFIITYL